MLQRPAPLRTGFLPASDQLRADPWIAPHTQVPRHCCEDSRRPSEGHPKVIRRSSEDDRLIGRHCRRHDRLRSRRLRRRRGRHVDVGRLRTMSQPRDELFGGEVGANTPLSLQRGKSGASRLRGIIPRLGRTRCGTPLRSPDGQSGRRYGRGVFVRFRAFSQTVFVGFGTFGIGWIYPNGPNPKRPHTHAAMRKGNGPRKECAGSDK